MLRCVPSKVEGMTDGHSSTSEATSINQAAAGLLRAADSWRDSKHQERRTRISYCVLCGRDLSFRRAHCSCLKVGLIISTAVLHCPKAPESFSLGFGLEAPEALRWTSTSPKT